MGYFHRTLDFCGLFRYGRDFVSLSGEVLEEARTVQSHLAKVNSCVAGYFLDLAVSDGYRLIHADELVLGRTIDFEAEYLRGMEPLTHERVTGKVMVYRDVICTEGEARFWIDFFMSCGAESVRVVCYGIGHTLDLVSVPEFDFRPREMGGDRAGIKRKKERAKNNEIVIPDCADFGRRVRGELDSELWLKTYLPDWFSVSFGEVHRRIIRKFDFAIQAGDLALEVCPRGSGKTTLARGLIIKSLLTKPEQLIILIGAKKAMASSSLKVILLAMVQSEKLALDYPEIIIPLREAHKKRQGARHFTVGGVNCDIVLNNDKMSLPFVTGRVNTGNVLEAVGFDANFRGMNRQSTHTGQTIRPSLILIDDMLKGDEAKNGRINAEKIEIVTRDICGLQGHTGERMGLIILGTITASGDAVEQLSNVTMYPQFRGTVTPSVLHWPAWAQKQTWSPLWRDYLALRDQEQDVERSESNAFYLANQAELEAGFEIYWETYQSGELSAVQHFMLIRHRIGAVSYEVEYQNAPQAQNGMNLSVNLYDMMKKLNGRSEFEASEGTQVICSADVNYHGITYVIGEVTAGGVANILHYGIWTPDGRRVLHDQKNPWATESEAIKSAVIGFAKSAQKFDWKIEVMSLDCGDWMEAILEGIGDVQGCVPFKVVPTRGVHNEQFVKYKAKKSGETMRNGVMLANWTVGTTYKTYWIYLVDVGIWGESTLTGWRLPMGEKGTITLFGTPEIQSIHAEFFRQISAQKLTGKVGSGLGYKYNWEVKGRNDYFDAVTYFRALSSFLKRSSWGIGQRQNMRDQVPESSPVNSDGFSPAITYDPSFSGEVW